MVRKILVIHQYATQNEEERKKKFNELLAKYINSQINKP